jgi:ubiquinone/menaquinone biosynthesis C-methylase UbiE
MPTEKEVYSNHAQEYEALVSREDYQGNLLKAINEVIDPNGLVALDLGTGTGRFACMLVRYVSRMMAFDLSLSMLEVAHDRLTRLDQGNWLVAASDHRALPMPAHSVDLVVSGWSVSYLTVWNPDDWRAQAEAWLSEAKRVLRGGGSIILFESLGTGTEKPQRLPHLENFYAWLNEMGFRDNWIRTDYRFESPEAGSEITAFFFGEEMGNRVERERLTVLPECTGMWWLKI